MLKQFLTAIRFSASAKDHVLSGSDLAGAPWLQEIAANVTWSLRVTAATPKADQLCAERLALSIQGRHGKRHIFFQAQEFLLVL